MDPSTLVLFPCMLLAQVSAPTPDPRPQPIPGPGPAAAPGPAQPTPGLRPAAITTEGVPEVPAELAATRHRYQDSRSASFADWLPDGGMLVASRIGNLHQLYTVREPAGKPEPATAGDEPVPGGIALEDGSVLFPRASGGD